MCQRALRAGLPALLRVVVLVGDGVSRVIGVPPPGGDSASAWCAVWTGAPNHALKTRIVVEQARGVVAERTGVDMAQSFSLLRVYARNHNLRLLDVAQAVIDGRLATASLKHPATRS